MPDCLSLIDTRVDVKQMERWTQVSEMTNVIHTEQVEIVSVAKGMLEIEPFHVPGIDCRIVGALVYHCCDTGAIHTWTEVVTPHVFQDGFDTCVNLTCWDIAGKSSSSEAEICWIDDPCARAKHFKNCLATLCTTGLKTAWSFRDSSGSTRWISESALTRLISTAESECEMACGANSRCATYRCSSGYC